MCTEMEIDLENAKEQDLTVEELRKYKGLENITDEQAEYVLKTLKEYSLLICTAVDNVYKNKIKYIDNQHIMSIFESTKAA